MRAEVNIPNTTTKNYKVPLSNYNGNDDLSGVFPSLLDHQTTFSHLVADIRGDGDNFVKMLVGDVDQKKILKLGHRVNEDYVKVLVVLINLFLYCCD